MKIIFRNFMLFLVTFSMLVMFTGIFEGIRNEYLYSTIEGSFINNASVNTAQINEYNTFKSSYIFTNSPYIQVINFVGELALLYIFVDAWRRGWKSRPLYLSQIFIIYGLLFILLVYFLIIIFNYLTGVFVNQIITVLFNDIYQETFIFKLVVDYFIAFFMVAVLLMFIANQVRHFKTIDI